MLLINLLLFFANATEQVILLKFLYIMMSHNVLFNQVQSIFGKRMEWWKYSIITETSEAT